MFTSSKKSVKLDPMVSNIEIVLLIVATSQDDFIRLKAFESYYR